MHHSVVPLFKVAMQDLYRVVVMLTLQNFKKGVITGFIKETSIKCDMNQNQNYICSCI